MGTWGRKEKEGREFIDKSEDSLQDKEWGKSRRWRIEGGCPIYSLFFVILRLILLVDPMNILGHFDGK